MEKYKLKTLSIGDKVKVIKAGYGVAHVDLNKIATVTGVSEDFGGRAEISTENFSGGYGFYHTKGKTLCDEHALRRITPAEEAGLVIGNKYVVVKEVGGNGCYFRVGEVVIFENDDNTTAPSFKWTTREPNQHKGSGSWYMNIDKVEPYIEDTRTPAQKAGFVIGEKYEVLDNGEEQGVGRWHRYIKGDVVEFTHDDNSERPEFKRISDGETQWMNFDQLKKYVDTRTPAQKAGLIIGQQYYVSVDSDSGSAGTIVYFTEDDGTDRPWFGDTERNLRHAPLISDVKPVSEAPNTTITFNKRLTEAQIAAIKALVE
jgi:hypothetical protein